MTFIRALYELSEHCDFSASRDEIVVGIIEKDVSRKLQLTKDLMLALTIETVRHSEEVHKSVCKERQWAPYTKSLTSAVKTHAIHATKLDTGVECVGTGKQ